jgi:gas vesicle protein
VIAVAVCCGMVLGGVVTAAALILILAPEPGFVPKDWTP